MYNLSKLIKIFILLNTNSHDYCWFFRYKLDLQLNNSHECSQQFLVLWVVECTSKHAASRNKHVARDIPHSTPLPKRKCTLSNQCNRKPLRAPLKKCTMKNPCSREEPSNQISICTLVLFGYVARLQTSTSHLCDQLFLCSFMSIVCFSNLSGKVLLLWHSSVVCNSVDFLYSTMVFHFKSLCSN